MHTVAAPPSGLVAVRISCRLGDDGSADARFHVAGFKKQSRSTRPRREQQMADVVEVPLDGSEVAGTGDPDGRQPKPKAIPHLTPAERAARGKAARAVAPRSGHGEWEPASDRRDPVELLEEQAASRVPELVPIRHGRLAATPFTFYRVGRSIRWRPTSRRRRPKTDIRAQLCGDAHLSNFGMFRGPDRRLVFDLLRLRRDDSRPVRVGCQAPGRQRHGRWPRGGLRRQAAASRSTAR